MFTTALVVVLGHADRVAQGEVIGKFQGEDRNWGAYYIQVEQANGTRISVLVEKSAWDAVDIGGYWPGRNVARKK